MTIHPHKHYDQQPLIEAVFELFAEPETKTLWTANSLDRLKTVLPDYAFHEERIRDLGIQLQLVGETLRPTSLQPRERVRRWDTARQKAVQFGSHMCAHNVLSPAYTHFKDHKDTVATILRYYLDEMKPERLGWIGQRYINNIRIPLADRDVAQYFEIYPRFPDKLSGGHRPLAIQIETVAFKNGVAMVNLSLQGSDDTHANYLLDIYARSNSELPPDADALLRWQTDAHEAVWESFQLSVSQKSKTELFKEQPWSS